MLMKDETMTERQKIALDNHCRLSCETVHPRFALLRHDGKSSIVTVNSGYE